MPEFYKQDYYDTATLESARLVLPYVVNRYKPGSAIDVGCGDGAWLAELKRLGVGKVRGIDGPHVTQSFIGPDEFITADLLQPLPDRLGTFDLALCLEVAEHLPESMADRLVDYLASLSKTIIFSAAIPGQGGHGHTHMKFPSYWVEKFSRRGYRPSDWLQREVWNDDRIQVWYRQNIVCLEYDPDCPYAIWRDVVHPDFYLYQMQVRGIKGFGL